MMTPEEKIILIAEDSKTQAEMLTFILESTGYRVIHGDDGEKALALTKKYNPALVISDVLMPRLDGYSLCKAIKEDPELQGIPVLLLTTLSTPADLIRGLNAGAESYIVKPYEENELLDWVKKLLQPRQEEDAAARRLENFLISTYQTAVQKNMELKSAKQELTYLNQNLIQKVAEQTMGLRQEIEEKKAIEIELKKAKEAAEHADRLKTAFLNNLSHEIRTPMNAILGFSTFITDPEISPEDRETFAGHITTGCSNLLAIIDSIVDLSIIESEKIDPAVDECRINTLMRSIHDAFREKESYQMEQIMFQLSLANPDDDFTILIDCARTRKVLVNLLKNALKFTEKGSIELGYRLNDPGYIEFFVRDTGTGIPSDKIGLIFEKFIKLEEFHKKKYSGTGVGLTITKKLVEFLGGSIRVESKVGVGSEFIIKMPLVVADKERRTTGSSMTEQEGAYADWSGRRILVAEDVESNFFLIETLLKRTQAEVLWARNGKEAVEMCSNGARIDLILMDIQMPVMDGYTAADHILKMGKGIPIVAQTAYALSHDEEDVLEAGFVDLLTKPIKIGELMCKIAKVFDTYKG